MPLIGHTSTSLLAASSTKYAPRAVTLTGGVAAITQLIGTPLPASLPTQQALWLANADHRHRQIPRHRCRYLPLPVAIPWNLL